MSLFTARVGVLQGNRRLSYPQVVLPCRTELEEDAEYDESESIYSDESESDESLAGYNMAPLSLRRFRQSLERRSFQISLPLLQHSKTTQEVIESHTTTTTRVMMQQMRKGDSKKMEEARGLTRWCNAQAQELSKYKRTRASMH